MAGSQQYTYINQSPDIGEKSSYVMMQNGTSQTYSSSTTTKSFMSTELSHFSSSKLYSEPSTSIDTVDASTFKTFEKAHNFMSNMNTNTIVSSNYKSSKTVTTSMKTVMNGTQQSFSDTNISETFSSKQSPCKSFIQQRVERLYGPGALAQGFFISTKRNKNRTSESEISEDCASKTVSNSVEKISSKDNGLESTCEFDNFTNNNDSNPSLPVLRHLRPEFRAQLPIMSPKRFSTDKNYQEVPVTHKMNGSNGTLDTSESSVNNKYNSFINEPETINELKHAKAVENFVNILKDSNSSVQTCDRNLTDSQISLESLTEYLPAAAQVVLPVPVQPIVGTKSDEVSKEVIVDECVEKLTVDEILEVKDGHYFLKVLKNETDRLICLAEQVEIELETKKNELSDEILGYLRSASGKARLLVSQKMQQFEGLCHKNINQLDEEQFPTTAEDLQGFWDMVMLQVKQVNDLFKDLNELRDNNWIEVKSKEKIVADSTQVKRKVMAPKKITTANSEAQRKQRELQRKQMLEQKRKAMAARKQNQEVGENFQNVEIFVPDAAMSNS